MNKNEEKLNIAIVHDHLGWSGGGERTALIMALELGADFITAHRDVNTFSDYQAQLGSKLKILSEKVINKEVIRFFWLRSLFWRNRKMLGDYDMLIASGQAATEAVAKYANKKATKILYNHTPPRRIFDLYEESKARYKWFLRPLFAIFAYYWRIIYLRAVQKIDFNIANSKNIQKRFKKYTKSNVNTVIWPPILTNNFKFIEHGDYFLSWARNDENKRVELIVQAFQKMPDQKLIVASGGNRLEQIKKMTSGYDNIQVLGWVSEKKLFNLVGRARAAIYIPKDEDAGMTHLEANAAGKPVLGVAEGGLLESIINGKTGVVIKKDPNVQDIINGIKNMTQDWCKARQIDCINYSKKYNKERFAKDIRKVVLENNPNIPVLGIDTSRWEDPRYSGEHIRTGVEEYSYNLIKNIARQADSRIRLRLYTPRLFQSLPNTIQKVIPRNKFWTWLGLTRELKFSQPDYFFTPSYYIPKSAPKNSYAVIHDVIFRAKPQLYSFLHRINLNLVTHKNIKRAKKIITISGFSKQEIIKEYKIDSDKIKVIPIGYTKKTEHQTMLNISPLNKILYIGRIETKKSVNVLIKAFAKLVKEKEFAHNHWKLILAGSFGYESEKIKELIKSLNLNSKIRLLGYISEEQKRILLKSVKILVHPSENEGSCIPLFEAWDAKTPAIVADIPVMREIGKDGVLYFKPGNADDLAQNIIKLVLNKDLQKSLIKKGQVNLNYLSWEAAANDVIGAMLN